MEYRAALAAHGVTHVICVHVHTRTHTCASLHTHSFSLSHTHTHWHTLTPLTQQVKTDDWESVPPYNETALMQALSMRVSVSIMSEQ